MPALKADGSFAQARRDRSRPPTSPATRSSAISSRNLFLEAIRNNRDLSEHHEEALNSLRIVFAADESIRTGEAVRF